MKLPLPLALVLALTACAVAPDNPLDESHYISRQAMGDSIMFLHYTGNIDNMNYSAMDYCGHRGKTAVVQSQVMVTDMRMNTSYLCR